MPSILSRLAALVGLALALAGCSGAGLLNAVTSRSGFESVRSLRYMPGERGTFDLYVPDGATSTTPVVVFFYGGSWDTGTKSVYPFVGQSLATEGFIVAVPDYRLYPEVRFPGFVEDGARAVAAVERLTREGGSGVPAGRHPIVLMGHSAGAEIGGLLAFDERYLARAGARDKLAGFAGLAGPYDFLPLTEERYKRIFPIETREASQPIRFVGSPGEPPAFLAVGLADTTVDPANTRRMAARIRATGGRVEERLYPDLDHIGAITSLATALPLGQRQLRSDLVRFLHTVTQGPAR